MPNDKTYEVQVLRIAYGSCNITINTGSIDEAKKEALNQTVDLDGEPQGIVATLLTSEKMEEVMESYNDYFEKAVDNDEDLDLTVDGLIEFMARNGYLAERVYIEDEIVLPS